MRRRSPTPPTPTLPRARLSDKAEILVRVIPRANKTELSGERDDALVVRVAAPPVEGAANDALGRIIADAIQSRLGCTAIVENRAGGAGLIGTKDVIMAKPDGYTLLASAFNTAVMPAVLKSADFDPETDLAVVGRTAVAPSAVWVREIAEKCPVQTANTPSPGSNSSSSSV